MNIWSHLIGFICVIVTGVHISYELLSVDNGQNQIIEVIAFESYVICAALCLLMSSFYHWFGCISESYHNCLLRLDLTGIGLLVTGSFIPGMYYGFYCAPEAQKVHCGLTLIVFLAGLSAPWIDWEINGRPVRPYIFGALVTLGVIPFAHWFYITPEVFKNEVAQEFLLMFFWYGVGFTLFLTKLPERMFPTSFLATQVFSSHALWHVCVLNAVYVWFHFLLQYRALLGEHGCKHYA